MSIAFLRQSGIWLLGLRNKTFEAEIEEVEKKVNEEISYVEVLTLQQHDPLLWRKLNEGKRQLK